MEINHLLSLYNTVGLKYIQRLGFGEVAVTFQCCTTVLQMDLKTFASMTIVSDTNDYVLADAYLNALTLEKNVIYGPATNFYTSNK